LRYINTLTYLLTYLGYCSATVGWVIITVKIMSLKWPQMCRMGR